MGKDLNKYRATLAHKINHSFNHNCRFEVVHHARFGLIPAVRTVQPVKKDDELLCHYNMPYDMSAPWYQELWRRGVIQKLFYIQL